MIRAVLRLIVSLSGVCIVLILVAFWLGSLKPREVIAYSSQPKSSWSDIYLMDLGSFFRVNLTHHVLHNYNTHPAWSLDGSRLAYFQSILGRSTAICVFDGATRCYVSSADYGAGLVWSPDGKSLSYRDQRFSNTIDTLDLDSGAVQSVRFSDIPTFWSWSPDGSQFVITTCGAAPLVLGMGTGCHLRLANSDLSGAHSVYRGSAYQSMPVWSPDSKRLVFATSDETTAAEIDVLDPASGKALRIADFVGSDPNWSPDGTEIAFTAADRSGRYRFYLINSKSGSPHALAEIGDWQTLQYAWSPDGSRILLVGAQSGAEDKLYVFDLKSKQIEPIPSGDGKKSGYTWRP